MMHFSLRETVAVISIGSLIFCCSCEKHPVGQDPEVQKENVGEGRNGEENAAEPAKTEDSEVSTKSPTPADFFPKATPSP